MPSRSVSKGTEVNTLLPGGLWLVSKFEGEFGGVKFEGRSGSSATTRRKKKYIGTVDRLDDRQHMSLLEGEYDAKTKTMTYVGEGTGPDGKTQIYAADGHHDERATGAAAFTLYMKVDKDEMKRSWRSLIRSGSDEPSHWCWPSGASATARPPPLTCIAPPPGGGSRRRSPRRAGGRGRARGGRRRSAPWAASRPR